MPVIAFRVSPRDPYTRHPANRDPKRLQWIRQQPCAVPGCKARYCEAAHVGPRALSRKQDDSETIPLCMFHHTSGNQSFHSLGRRRFEAVHKLDIEQLLRELKDWYEVETRTA
jgi:hypothetical protein